MRTAADMRVETRSYLSALVERIERSTGSRMAAYENLSRLVGVSSDWIRKIIGRRFAEVEAHEFENIKAAYERLCMRIETSAAKKEAEAADLRKKLDEINEGNTSVVARVAREPSISEGD